mgnify:CR=1 FL=1
MALQIGIVGLPNVGKSTLFNRLTKSRDAIVADVSGLTRDRQYGEAVWQGKPYIVVDTGGISGDEEGLDLMMAGQSLQAIEEADAVLFLVDARAGRTAGDEQIAAHLRKRNKHTYLIANKIDGADPDAILGEFATLGLGQPLGIAAAHGRNINPMLDAVLNDESLQVSGEEGRVVEPIGTKIAIIGRPNVGKSTLVNRLCRSREAIVHDEPGVTRDRTYQDGYWGDREFKVVDTGGLVFDDDSEFLPEIREQAALAMEEASVAVVIVDGQQGITAADESIAEFLRSRACPTLLAVNKCESPEQGLAMAAEFWSLGLGEPHPISAIHGVGTGDLLDQVLTFLPPKDQEGEEEEPIQMAIIGRPNVGKSSLLNRLAGWAGFLSRTEVDDSVIRTIASPRQQKLNQGSVYTDYGGQIDKTLPNVINRAASDVGMAVGGLAYFPAMDVVRQALPMVLAFLKMALVICIPIVLLIGTYDLKTVITLTVVQFALFFTDFWLQLARWIDSTILDALYGWGFGWNRPHTNFDPLDALLSVKWILCFG